MVSDSSRCSAIASIRCCSCNNYGLIASSPRRSSAPSDQRVRAGHVRPACRSCARLVEVLVSIPARRDTDQLCVSCIDGAPRHRRQRRRGGRHGRALGTVSALDLRTVHRSVGRTSSRVRQHCAGLRWGGMAGARPGRGDWCRFRFPGAASTDPPPQLLLRLRQFRCASRNSIAPDLSRVGRRFIARAYITPSSTGFCHTPVRLSTGCVPWWKSACQSALVCALS